MSADTPSSPAAKPSPAFLCTAVGLDARRNRSVPCERAVDHDGAHQAGDWCWLDEQSINRRPPAPSSSGETPAPGLSAAGRTLLHDRERERASFNDGAPVRPVPGDAGHPTTPIQVWADVDVGIAALVVDLNAIRGVRTFASCQGSIGEGGPAPYGPYVMAAWPAEIGERLAAQYEIELLGECWGYVRPRTPQSLTDSQREGAGVVFLPQHPMTRLPRSESPDPRDAEIARLRASEQQAMDHATQCDAAYARAEDDAARLRAEVERWQAAFRNFGGHHEDCPRLTRVAGWCDCGYSRLIRELDAAATPPAGEPRGV